MQENGFYDTITSDYSYNDISIINRFIAIKNPFRYRSYYYDFETNLYYLNSRYYDPETGRFINADDIGTIELSQITLNGLNLYAYCLNNPVNEVDRNGYLIGWLIFTIIASAIIGGISKTVKAVQNGATTGQAIASFFSGAFTSAILVTSLILGVVTGLATAGIGFAIQAPALLVFGTSVFLGGFAKGLDYTFDVAIYNKKWDTKDFFKSVTSGILQGVLNFGIGFFGGLYGAYDSLAGYNLIDKLFIADIIKNPIRTFITNIAWNLGEALTRFIFITIPSFIQKYILNKL